MSPWWRVQWACVLLFLLFALGMLAYELWLGTQPPLG
jgi:hypothetical protein